MSDPRNVTVLPFQRLAYSLLLRASIAAFQSIGLNAIPPSCVSTEIIISQYTQKTLTLLYHSTKPASEFARLCNMGHDMHDML